MLKITINLIFSSFFFIASCFAAEVPDRIAGVVHDADDRPVENAWIVFKVAASSRFRYYDGQGYQLFFSGHTDQSGNFSVDTTTQDDETDADRRRRKRKEYAFRNVIALKPGVGFVYVPLNALDFSDKIADQEAFVAPDFSKPLKLKLVRAKPLEVAVRDMRGRPVSGLDVYLGLKELGRYDSYPLRFDLPPVRSGLSGVARFDWFPETGIDDCRFSTAEVPANDWLGLPGAKTDYREMEPGRYIAENGPAENAARPEIRVVKTMSMPVLVRDVDGRPMEEITILCDGLEVVEDKNASREYHHETFETDEQGKARLAVCPGFVYRISIENERYYARSISNTVFQTETPPESLVFTLKPKTRITGTVRELHPVDAEDPPGRMRSRSIIAGAADVGVEVLDDAEDSLPILWNEPHFRGFNYTNGWGYVGRTPNRGGDFEGYLPPGKYRIKIDWRNEPPEGGETNAGIPSNSRIVTVTDQKEITVSLFYLEREKEPGPVKLRFVDGTTSRPLADAEIRHTAWFGGDSYETARTDADGVFVLQPEHYNILGDTTQIFRTPDDRLCAFEEFAKGATEHTVTMRPPATITGRMLDETAAEMTRKPVRKMLVQASIHYKDNSSAAFATVHTDADGIFVLKNLPPGRKYRLEASDKAEVSSVNSKILLSSIRPPEGETDLGDIFVGEDRVRLDWKPTEREEKP